VVEDARAVVAFNPVPERVETLVQRGIIALTGKDTAQAAWGSLVSTQETVGIKVFSKPGATIGTRPAVVSAVVKGLIDGGHDPRKIIVWDKHLADLRFSGYCELAHQYGIRVAGSAEEGYDENVFYESALLGRLVWGDFEFGKKTENAGRKSYVSKLLTQQVTKLINVTPLLNHNHAAVSGNLYSLAFGSVDNTLRFENMSDRLAQAVPEIYALEALSDRVVLNIVDGLICQYQGEELGLLHYSTMLGQVRLSTDPVALDVLSVRELDRQRELARMAPVKLDGQIYTNATLLELGISDPRYIDIIRP
jgi:hypothetical protein